MGRQCLDRDSIFEDMHSRFTKKENENLFTLMQLIPSNVVKTNNNTTLKTSLEEISDIIMKNPNFKEVPKELIHFELELWCSKW